MMENDDPGPVVVNGKLVNEGVYTEPTGHPVKNTSFDVTAVHSTDASATFSDIALKGDFYNGIRGGSAVICGPAGCSLAGENMVLTFDNSRVAGVISASETHHAISPITSVDYKQPGEVTNIVHPIINNGVIVSLNGDSKWTVTGTSYLSKLVVAADAAVTAPVGHTVAMTVDGVTTTIVPGSTYTGSIVLTVH